MNVKHKKYWGSLFYSTGGPRPANEEWRTTYSTHYSKKFEPSKSWEKYYRIQKEREFGATKEKLLKHMARCQPNEFMKCFIRDLQRLEKNMFPPQPSPPAKTPVYPPDFALRPWQQHFCPKLQNPPCPKHGFDKLPLNQCGRQGSPPKVCFRRPETLSARDKPSLDFHPCLCPCQTIPPQDPYGESTTIPGHPPSVCPLFSSRPCPNHRSYAQQTSEECRCTQREIRQLLQQFPSDKEAVLPSSKGNPYNNQAALEPLQPCSCAKQTADQHSGQCTCAFQLTEPCPCAQRVALRQDCNVQPCVLLGQQRPSCATPRHQMKNCPEQVSDPRCGLYIQGKKMI